MRIGVKNIADHSSESINHRPHHGKKHQKSHYQEQIKSKTPPPFAKDTSLDNSQLKTFGYDSVGRKNGISVNHQKKKSNQSHQPEDNSLVYFDVTHPALPSFQIVRSRLKSMAGGSHCLRFPGDGVGDSAGVSAHPQLLVAIPQRNAEIEHASRPGEDNRSQKNVNIDSPRNISKIKKSF